MDLLCNSLLSLRYFLSSNNPHKAVSLSLHKTLSDQSFSFQHMSLLAANHSIMTIGLIVFVYHQPVLNCHLEQSHYQSLNSSFLKYRFGQYTYHQRFHASQDCRRVNKQILSHYPSYQCEAHCLRHLKARRTVPLMKYCHQQAHL